MKVCVVSLKECWQQEDGRWYADGGFPLQMRSIGSLFSGMTLVIVETSPRAGGIALPEFATVVPLPRPVGADTRRKVSVLLNLHRYLGPMIRHARANDVVHVPLPGDMPFLGLLVAVFLNKRLLARYGGSWAANSRTTLMNRVTRTAMRLLSGSKNVLLATGEGASASDGAVNWVFASALTQAEISSICPVLDRGLNRRPKLACIGRLSPEKELGNLIRIVRAIRDRGLSPVPFISLIGDGPERARLESLVRDSGCAEDFHFYGQLDRTKLSAALLEHDLCIHTSATEGYSKAWLDAMAHGLPVLCCDVGAARAVVGTAGERGWLVQPGSWEAVLECLVDVLTADHDWPEIRMRCRRYAESRTLELWRDRIGNICAQQWDVQFEGGRLTT